MKIFLFKTMNVRFECSTPEDGFYGTKVNGRWNGVLGDLYRFAPKTIFEV